MITELVDERHLERDRAARAALIQASRLPEGEPLLGLHEGRGRQTPLHPHRWPASIPPERHRGVRARRTWLGPSFERTASAGTCASRMAKLRCAMARAGIVSGYRHICRRCKPTSECSATPTRRSRLSTHTSPRLSAGADRPPETHQTCFPLVTATGKRRRRCGFRETWLETVPRAEARGVGWSGKPDSNRRPSAWEADALPTELFPPGSREG
jgi:hypothetical protein